VAFFKSSVSSLVAQLNSNVEAEAKRAASALNDIFYPKYPGIYTAAEGQRIQYNHYVAIRGSPMVKPLLKTARGGTDFARAYATTVLGTIGDSRAIPLLLDALCANAPTVRQAATKGLMYFRDPSTVSALTHALEDSSYEVRCSAASTLGFIGSAEAVPSLLAFYEGGDQRAKVAALHALGYIHDPRSLPLVRSALLNRVRKIRGAAKHVLAYYDFKRRKKAK
jgi:hypothetical protein